MKKFGEKYKLKIFSLGHFIEKSIKFKTFGTD